jgi:polyhydroxyalkanoate synthase
MTIQSETTALPEHMASPWLCPAADTDGDPGHAGAELDLAFNAWLAKFTGNISPAAILGAYADWLTHLAMSPSKQTALLQKASGKIRDWQAMAIGMGGGNGAQPTLCVTPLPQDKRFSSEAWQAWPFNAISQGFLMTQQWWHNATTDVVGVSQHHQDVVTFTVRQLLDMLAPSNFLSTNPVLQQETIREGGANLQRGAALAWSDWQAGLAGQGDGKNADERFKIGETLAATPGKVVFRNRLIELIQYAPATKTAHATPVLFVPAWIMKYYILDLSPGNSLVEYLVGKGHSVFMISWKNPDAGDRDLSMEDYRQLGVMDAIDAVERISGQSRVNAVGYCLGGTLLTIAAAAMARDGDQRLASMSLFASQTDFTEPGELSVFIDESQVSFLEAIMWKQGYLDTKQMAGAFQLLRSNDLIWSHRLNQYLLGIPEGKSDLMAWNADATRMPYRMHSEYLRELFLKNDLANGRYAVGDRPISLNDIHIPIFAVGTVTDHVAPWRSVYKLLRLTDTEVTFLLTSGGHNAGVVSPPGHPHRSYRIAEHARDDAHIDPEQWQTEAPLHDGSWWPAWEAWLAARAGKKIKPPAMGSDLGAAPGTYVIQP